MATTAQLADLRTTLLPDHMVAAALQLWLEEDGFMRGDITSRAMQHEGDTDFSGSIGRLREVVEAIGYPVVLKEVGHGIGAAAAAELVDCPLAAVDVAGGKAVRLTQGEAGSGETAEHASGGAAPRGRRPLHERQEDGSGGVGVDGGLVVGVQHLHAVVGQRAETVRR